VKQEKCENGFIAAVFALVIAASIVSGCSRPVSNKNTAPTPTPETSPTPSVSEPEAIKNDVNVSFSSYSDDWPKGWRWIDPDEAHAPTPHDVKRGVLRVRIPSGKELRGKYANAPRYVKAIEGDFEIETRVRFRPTENYQGAGLIIYVSDLNYVRLERGYGGIGGGAGSIRFDARLNGEFTPVSQPGDTETDAEMVDLKLVRSGNLILAYWRLDEENPWREVGEYEAAFPQTVLAGLMAANTARETTAEFLYIKLSPSSSR
jgi:regulation of enolase protein 1 (concanavalin A-like superfamily)